MNENTSPKFDGLNRCQPRDFKAYLVSRQNAANPADTVSFWRVWNLPRRGLGPIVRGQVETVMGERGTGPLEALEAVIAGTTLNRPARAGAEGFVALMRELMSRRADRAGGWSQALQHGYLWGDRTLGVMPLYHTMGDHSLIAMSLIGGCYLCQPEWDAAEQASRLSYGASVRLRPSTVATEPSCQVACRFF